MSRLGRPSFAIFLILAWLEMFTACAHALTVATVDGEEITGALEAFDAKAGKMTLVSGDKKTEVDCAKVVEIFFERPGVSAPRLDFKLTLSNGDVVLGDFVKGGDETLEVKSPLLGNFKFDFALILDAVRMGNVENPFEKVAATGENDFMKIRASNQEQTLKGAILEVTAEGISMETTVGGAKLMVDKKWQDILSFGFITDAVKTPDGLQAIIKATDNSRLSGAIVSLDEERLTLQSALRQDPIVIPLARVGSISFANSTFVYLSDLKPVKVEENYLFPDFSVKFPPRMDSGVMDDPISLRGRIYRKGIGVHADSRITFNLDGQYKRFRVDVGVHDGVKDLADGGRLASVVFRVIVDGKEIYKSPETVTIKTPIQKIDVDLAGGKELVLEVLNADGSISQDRAAWAGAMLLK